MFFREGEQPFRHPYGSCISNIPINELMQAGLPYYPLFAHRLDFEYIPEEGKLLGESIKVFLGSPKYCRDIMSQLYGLEYYIEDKDNDKETLLRKIKKILENASVPCLIDCYYDPSTEYANVYQKVHQGHGRIVTKMDSEYVYYYATHIDDPKECFRISLDDFYLACNGIFCFQYPVVPKSRKERHASLQNLLVECFVEKDYQKMLEDIEKFSAAVRSKPSLREETENQFPPNKIPTSQLFRYLVQLGYSRGATVTFLKGYMEEFGNNAYQDSIQCFEHSVELWNRAKALVVKYAMEPNQSIPKAIADCLLEIRKTEERAIVMVERNVIEEIHI